MLKYLVYLSSELGGDNAAFAAAQEVSARIVAAVGGTRTPIPDYPDDNNIARNLVPPGRGYGIGVQPVDHPVLTGPEIASLVNQLPADGDRTWGSVIGP